LRRSPEVFLQRLADSPTCAPFQFLDVFSGTGSFDRMNKMIRIKREGYLGMIYVVKELAGTEVHNAPGFGFLESECTYAKILSYSDHFVHSV
jgi:hypothetical protein